MVAMEDRDVMVEESPWSPDEPLEDAGAEANMDVMPASDC